MPDQRDAERRLLAIPTSAPHKKIVAGMVERFHPRFDICLFVWDGSTFDEDAFSACQVIYRQGYNKWDFGREYLTAEFCEPYEFLFFWDDDLDVRQFDPELFLDVLRENRLEIAQPAITRDSYASHQITIQRPGVGRFTDFVELMCPVFTRDAWPKWQKMLMPENPWGWGYDLAARSACGYERMGIIDCTPVRHLKRPNKLPAQFEGMRKFVEVHPEYRPCKRQELGPLVGASASQVSIEQAVRADR